MQIRFTDRKFSRIGLDNSHLTSNRLILSLLADYDHNCIWVGVEGTVLGMILLLSSRTLNLFSTVTRSSHYFSTTSIVYGPEPTMAYLFTNLRRKHRLIRHDALNDRSILNNVVWSVFTDWEHNIWIGTDAGASLFSYNENFKVQSISELTGSDEGNHVISLLADSRGNLWLGGTNGLIRVDKLRLEQRYGISKTAANTRYLIISAACL